MEEMKKLKIKEIFNKEQLKELKKFLKEKEKEKKEPLELTTELRELFGKWEEDLMAKGILPDYLAYAFAYLLSRVGYERMIFEVKMSIKKKLNEVL